MLSPPTLDRMLERLARYSVRHRWIVIGIWVGLLVVINGVAGGIGADYHTDFTLPDGESLQVQERLESADPRLGNFSAQIVAEADQGIDDPAVRAQLDKLYQFAAEQNGIVLTSPYDAPEQISADGRIGYARLDVEDLTLEQITELGDEIREFGDNELSDVDGLTIEYGGDIFAEFELPESEVYGVTSPRQWWQ